MYPYSLYVHIPFCRRRCSYCDFNTYSGQEGLMGAYVEALAAEIEWVARAAAQAEGKQPAAHTVYFGGGTPSLLPPAAVGRILAALGEGFALEAGAEITLEANPGTVGKELLREVRRLGVNRLSLGAQSLHAAELALLGREHDFGEVIEALKWARQAGFDNVNLDLIFGLPGQSLAGWEQTLGWAIRLGVEHLSLYALTLEAGTPLEAWVRRGQVNAPDEELAADMYELAEARLAEAGYVQYEISNWARADKPLGESETPGRASRHNLQYWRNRPYLGFGAGAHGYAAGRRVANARLPADYIERLAKRRSPAAEGLFPLSPATVEVTRIDRTAEIGETMMLGLRLTREGVAEESFRARFGETLRAVFGKQIEQFLGEGLLEWGGAAGDVLRLTRRGRLLGNRVFAAFV